MSENTKIEWCDHTFNPWEGCQKVGPGCDHCYAETRNARFGGGHAPNWGPGAPRRRTGKDTWGNPIKWQKRAAEFMAQHGRRQRVFCASLADVFDNEVPTEWRIDLFKLIAATPDLDWLLLTKRIGNAKGMLDEVARAQPIPMRQTDREPLSWRPMNNVWIGATITSQSEADRDIPKLLAVPAKVRFLSMEPLLGPINLTDISDGHADSTIPRSYWLEDFDTEDSPPAVGHNALTGERWQRFGEWSEHGAAVSWVIVGGESGAGARPMHPDWARSLRDQCAAAGVPFLFKQWGEWAPAIQGQCAAGKTLTIEGAAPFTDRPQWHDFDDGLMVARIGKRAAGRRLDGIEHNGFPSPEPRND
jgi:protein gp37